MNVLDSTQVVSSEGFKPPQSTLRKVRVLVGPTGVGDSPPPLLVTPSDPNGNTSFNASSTHCPHCGGGCFVDNQVTSEFERNHAIEPSTRNLTDFSTRCSWTTHRCIPTSTFPFPTQETPDDQCFKEPELWRPYLEDTACSNGQSQVSTRTPCWNQFESLMSPKPGDRPYQCDHGSCRKAFARNEELTRHKRIHSGERPHQCEMCRKSFGRKDHLTKHRKTHLKPSERRTYACPIVGCERRYTRSDALTRHQWSVHNIKWRPCKIV